MSEALRTDQFVDLVRCFMTVGIKEADAKAAILAANENGLLRITESFAVESAPDREATRFAEFDDEGHPANIWWKQHGQYMMSGGGRQQFIWACRGWIAREQLMSGVSSNRRCAGRISLRVRTCSRGRG